MAHEMLRAERKGNKLIERHMVNRAVEELL